MKQPTQSFQIDNFLMRGGFGNDFCAKIPRTGENSKNAVKG